MEFYKKALAIQRQTLGNTHPDLARTLGEFGGLYLRQSLFDKAEAVYIESERIRREVIIPSFFFFCCFIYFFSAYFIYFYLDIGRRTHGLCKLSIESGCA